MFTYLKNSFARKIARRFTKEYPPIIDHLNMNQYGEIDFANWSSPLAPKITLNEATVAFFNQFIKAGDLAIDIGANIGTHTIAYANILGVENVIAIEPNIECVECLKKNIPGIFVIEAAVSDINGEGKLCLLKNVGASYMYEGSGIKTIKLDDYESLLSSNVKNKKFTFLKILYAIY